MSILSNAKEVAELIKKYNDQELYEKIVNLRDEIFELREENLTLKEKVKELNATLETKKEIVRRGNVYIFKDDVNNDDDKNIPWFCMACWDHDRKLINVTKEVYNSMKGKSTKIKCAICNSRQNSK